MTAGLSKDAGDPWPFLSARADVAGAFKLARRSRVLQTHSTARSHADEGRSSQNADYLREDVDRACDHKPDDCQRESTDCAAINSFARTASGIASVDSKLWSW